MDLDQIHIGVDYVLKIGSYVEVVGRVTHINKEDDHYPLVIEVIQSNAANKGWIPGLTTGVDPSEVVRPAIPKLRGGSLKLKN